MRRPQIGALHSIVGYWSYGLEAPGIVVMPTGTGKTETMIASRCPARRTCARSCPGDALDPTARTG
ncbi:DEAD/DEAH box helicase family protein [Actinophytocola sp.]|uniref:DEAD/DEAH box helicase family protein n=1 Tax=Actinophytocola sp. TaxID=1872138 RepID=UPI003D6B08D4